MDKREVVLGLGVRLGPGGAVDGCRRGPALEERMADLPYMKLWTQKFFGSIRVQALRGEHRLIYLGLLVAEWGLDGKGLPNDLGEMARILGISEDSMRDAWGDGGSRVSQFFDLRDGRLFNETLEWQLKCDRRSHSLLSAAGKRGRRKQLEERLGRGPGLARAYADGDGDDDASSGVLKTQEEHPDIRGGGLGEGGPLQVRLEARYDKAAGSLLDRIGKFARCAPQKAEAIYLRLREPKAETFAAWQRYAAKHGKPDAIGSMQNYDHPCEVPHDPEHEDRSKGKSRDERVGSVLRQYPRPKKYTVDPVSMADALNDLRKKIKE